MSRKKTETEGGKEATPGFEQALERLETIVREMESGELSLEAMVARFEEGQKLVRYCGETLAQVERKIEILVKEGEKVTARPFDAAGGAGDAGGAEEEPESGKTGNLPF